MKIGKLLAMITVACGSWHLITGDGFLHGVEGILVCGIGLLMDSTNKVIEAIKEKE